MRSSAAAALGSVLLLVSQALSLPVESTCFAPPARFASDGHGRPGGIEGYRFHRESAGSWSANNKSQGLSATIGADGLVVTPLEIAPGSDRAARWKVALLLSRFGRPGTMRRAATPRTRLDGPRLQVQRDDLVEWYLNDSRGVEQGFTFRSAPGGRRSAPLQLQMQVAVAGGSILARDGGGLLLKTAVGEPILRYTGLSATDADGRSLPATLRWSRGRITIRVDDTGARYPVTIDPLVTSPSWTADGLQDAAHFGSVVATGDFNGDNRKDVLVGAPDYDLFDPDLGLNNQGRVSLYFGSSFGLSGPIWTVTGDQPYSYFGSSVASAGDVNGDGVDDIIVGAPRFMRDVINYPDNPGTGQVSLYLGFSNIPAWKGGPSGSLDYGRAVASAGDVNGDGRADIIVGDPWFGNGQAYEGRAFLYYGQGGGATDDPVWTAESDVPFAYFGSSVASAGDVNGDGYDDVIVGAPNFGSVTTGRVYVYHGGPGGLSANPDWSVSYAGPVFHYGRSVASAGDVNGDGYDDVIVGSDTFSQNGEAFVYLGSANGLGTTPAWTAFGAQAGDEFGTSVAGAGDVNHDGYADVVIGSPSAAGAAGKVLVYLGSRNGLLSQPVWTTGSDSAPAALGLSVASGDFNGDGRSDVVAGAPLSSNGFTEEGRAAMYLATAEDQILLLDPMCTTTTTCGGRYLVESNGSVSLDPDPEKLMLADVPRLGAVTDGVTRLLVRQRSDVPVTFLLLAPDGTPAGPDWGRLTRRDGTGAGNTLTVTPDVVSSGGVAFAAYEAPADFPGAATQVGTGVDVTITTLTASDTEGTKLKLVPPPVVLVHGLWSNEEAWQKPAGGLRKDLIDRGYLVCPECVVDYGREEPAGSFDPRETTSTGQYPVNQLIVATQYARDWARNLGFAATQVDVVGHSMGGLMARSRVASTWRPYVTKYTYDAGDFHKIITVGTPHLGTPLADYLVAHKCALIPIPGGFTHLEDALGFVDKPLDPAVYQLQTNSLALEHLNAAPLPVPTHPIVGIEPPSGSSCTESCTQDALDALLLLTGTLQTIDDLLGGQQNHDTIVPRASQSAGLQGPFSVVPNVVHANLSIGFLGPLLGTDTGETESQDVRNEVERLLRAPRQSDFAYLSPFIRTGNPIAPSSCPILGAARPAPAQAASVTLLPSPGTVVQPGDTITISLEVTGGGPVAGAVFLVGGGIARLDGTGPFSIDYRVPDDTAGTINIYAATFGPGPDNYGDFTHLVVRKGASPVSLRAAPDHLALDSLGEAVPILVKGRYADGSEIDLTSTDAGTTYAVAGGTTQVVSVGPGSLVTALGAGQDAIVISNGGLAISVPVSVSITNLAPALAPIGEIVLRADDVLNLPVSATDPDGNALSLSAADLPGFADFVDLGGGNGRLSLAPHRTDVGSYPILIAVADDGVPALGSGITVTITVQPCGAPTPTGVPVMTVDSTTYSWTPIEGATSYDLVAGDVGALTAGGGGYAAATLACVRNDLTATSLYFPVPPPLGRAYWFLVRGTNCGGNGTYDSGDAGQVGPSDPGIAASGRDCP